jgi:hypothetical protein
LDVLKKKNKDSVSDKSVILKEFRRLITGLREEDIRQRLFQGGFLTWCRDCKIAEHVEANIRNVTAAKEEKW